MTADDSRDPYGGREPGSARDATDVLLWRLANIETRLDKLVSAEVYEHRHKHLVDRVTDLEHDQHENHKNVRQIVVGLIVAAGTAGISLLATLGG